VLNFPHTIAEKNAIQQWPTAALRFTSMAKDNID
jgi:hypothetical protein